MKKEIITFLKGAGFWALFYFGVRSIDKDGVAGFVGSALLCIWCFRVYRGLK